MRPTLPDVVVSTSLLVSQAAFALFSQQGPKLVGSGAVGFAFQGQSVSLSADGNTAIVGGEGDNGNVGAAWVWTRNGGVWTQQGPKLVGSGAVGNADQGWDVALSADGNTAIVGGITDNNSAGAAWVWVRSGGVWTQQGAKLVGAGAVGGANQGISVSLSADGNTAIVGGPRDNANTGAAWVWTRSGGVWTQQGTKLVGSGAVGHAAQGVSVSLAADGDTAIIGGASDNSSAGAAWVWTRSGGVWSQQGSKLVGSGALPDTFGNAQQGISTAISGDGNTAAEGANLDNNDAGAAWVWTRSGGVWTQEGTKLVGSGAVGTAYRGSSVSLSADGNALIVGGPGDNSFTGAAWVWTRNGGVWSQQGSKLVGLGALTTIEEGWSVSLSADSKTAILGAPNDGGENGAAWVFSASTADMSTMKSVTGGPAFPAGGNLSFTVSVTNNGPDTANSVVMTDGLPPGTTFVSATPSQGSCSGTTTVSCALGTLANGGTATINLVVKTSSTPGPVSNTATVSATEADPNTTNNSSTSTITTVDPALLPSVSHWALIAMVGMLAFLGAMRLRT